MTSVRGLAQEAVSWYLSHMEECAPHAENISRFFRGPVIALTISILSSSSSNEAAPEVAELSGLAEGEGGEATDPPPAEASKNSSWKAYLDDSLQSVQSSLESVSEFSAKNAEQYDKLPKRAKDRLEAFLYGVSLALPSLGEDSTTTTTASASSTKAPSKNTAPPTTANGTTLINKSLAEKQKQYADKSNGETGHSFSLIEGLAGFRSMEKGAAGGGGGGGLQVFRSISMSSSKSSVITKRPQISERDLVTRLELYLRSLYRVKSMGRDCVVAAEPMRAVKARADAITCAFVDTVSTVRQQGPVLTRLLVTMTKELLANDVISEELTKVVRRMVSEYEQKTSFASLAFLSSPENSAAHLTPMVLKYLRYLRSNWKRCEADCALEHMLRECLDPKMRHTFKTVEFRSIGHLLEVCHRYRSELQHIEFPPATKIALGTSNGGNSEMGREQEETRYGMDDENAIQQALRDLQREVITVNGHVLPPVTSRSEMIRLLSQTLNSRSLTAKLPRKSRRRRRRKGVKREDSDSSELSTDDTSGNEGDVWVEGDGTPSPRRHSVHPDSSSAHGSVGRNRSFRLSTIDFLTKRLLLAGSRTGTGGDAYFVVLDLFGGDDVEVVSSSALRAQRRETIEIIVRLASVTIRCHGSFDVYPKYLVGSCEPLIQVHTTTSETIGLQEVRACDISSGSNAAGKEKYESDEDKPNIMVVQERKTERSGWRTLSVRPALYEKVEVWNTPS